MAALNGGMRLERRIYQVDEIGFGPRTAYDHGRLQIDRQALVDLALQDDRLTHCNVELVSPGENARVVHICDTAEPQARLDGGSFPGWASDITTAGHGRSACLRGAGLTVCCELPWRKTGGIQIPRESIAEMRGPLAATNPLSELHNIVVELRLREGLADEDCDRAVLGAELRLADYVARQAAAEQEPSRVEVFELGEVDPALPRVVYVAQITSQGPFAGTFYYGGYLDRLLPTYVHPNEILDGALVGGATAGPWIRIPTINHQKHAVINGLYRDHGRDLCFAGVVLLRGHYYGMEDKFRVAAQASKLVRCLGADGAIFTWENAGNGLMECMYTLQACEQAGVKTVFITWEHGGNGDDVPLQFYVPEAVAMVSAGSMDPPTTLPEVERVVGGGDTLRLNPQLGGERVAAKGPIDLDWRLELYAGGGQAGNTKMARADF